MIMKTLVLAALFLSLASATHAAKIHGPGCGFEWTYPATEQDRIDGFRLFVNGKPIDRPATERALSCAEAKLSDGQIAVYLVAFSGKRVSAPSNTLTFRYSSAALVPPSNASIVIEFIAIEFPAPTPQTPQAPQ